MSMGLSALPYSGLYSPASNKEYPIVMISSLHPALGFALGGPEIILILCVLILLFGAKKLPELARGIGKSMNEFKKASKENDAEAPEASDADLATTKAAKREEAGKN